jgi:hypothetical protein
MPTDQADDDSALVLVGHHPSLNLTAPPAAAATP